MVEERSSGVITYNGLQVSDGQSWAVSVVIGSWDKNVNKLNRLHNVP
jgi:hypothetical protein